jgi:hypothetical protein
VRAEIVLSGEEAKRIIAKGIVALEEVKRAKEDGIVFVSRGSTNAYILEELLGEEIEKEKYAVGMILRDRLCLNREMIGEVAIIKGEVIKMSADEVIEKMDSDDVFIKGASVIDRNFIPGVLLANERGGVVGKTLGSIYARGVNLIIPASVMKFLPVELRDLVRDSGITRVEYSTGIPVGISPLYGRLFTEIDAFEVLFGVRTFPLGFSDLDGACIAFLLEGEDGDVRRAIDLIREIKGEKKMEWRSKECKSCNEKTCFWTGGERPY